MPDCEKATSPKSKACSSLKEYQAMKKLKSKHCSSILNTAATIPTTTTTTTTTTATATNTASTATASTPTASTPTASASIPTASVTTPTASAITATTKATTARATTATTISTQKKSAHSSASLLITKKSAAAAANTLKKANTCDKAKDRASKLPETGLQTSATVTDKGQMGELKILELIDLDRIYTASFESKIGSLVFDSNSNDPKNESTNLKNLEISFLS